MSIEFAPGEDGSTEPIRLFGRLAVPALPAPTTPIIGRESELGRVVDMLDNPEIRLITLTGPGGIGKTRLGVAIAHEVPGPAAFVSLAATVDPDLLIPTIVQAVGLEPAWDTPPDLALRQALQGRELLLVLDNFEQPLTGTVALGSLLRACAGLRVLVTSRVRLGLAGEHVVPVEPLALPDRSSGNIAEASAVRLFVDRARAAHPGFVLTERNAGAVADVCRRLDGLPLAIELAAARSNLLSPEALAARLERRLNVLTGGPHDAPSRHQTMRAAIAWSNDLLGDPERRFWERLGVFAGGFTAEAAEVVGKTASEPDLDGIATLQLLIDQGLLQPAVGRDGEPQFHMLETTREFALEQMAAKNEDDVARAAHAEWFRTYAKRLEPGLMGNDPDPWFGRADADIANFRAALGWFRDSGRVAAALEMAGALAWFWTAPNYIAEGRDWYADLLARAGPDVDPALKAKAMQAAGDLAVWHGDSTAAAQLLGEAVTLWREVGDQGKIAATLRSLGSVAIDRWAFDEAAELLAEAFRLSSESGHGWDAAAAANLLGIALNELGRYAEAVRWHEEALVGWQRLGNRDHLPAALAGLGWTRFRTADYQQSRECFDAAISLSDEAGYDPLWAMVGFAAIAHHFGHTRVAAELLGAVARHRSQLGLPLRPHSTLLVERLTDDIRAAIGNAAFAVAWSDGQELGYADTIRLARAVPLPAPPASDGLSRREREVLGLLVEGASDGEIADRLFISRGTASKHVAAILDKLGATNRTAAAIAAIRRGLI